MMTCDQVRTLHRVGHIIVSHTVTHPNMAYMGAEDLRIERVESKKNLEKELGAAIPHFSYPSPILQPHWSQEALQCTEEAGYRCAVTSTAGPAQKRHHPLALQRVVVPADTHVLVWNLERTLLSRRFPCFLCVALLAARVVTTPS